jgi:hypothetical protein
MNLLEALARKLKNDWTGGASGDPGRYHAPGAFKDFRIADLFNNDRWTREPMVDPNSISGYLENRDDTPRYTSYYKPRGAVDVTETEKIDNKGETTTQVVTKYQVGKPEVTSEPFPRVAGSGARVSDPMNTRPGTFIGSLHHPPNIAGMGSRVAPQPRRTEDEGREEEVWKVYTRLREAGYSKEDAARATAIFLSRGDVPIGLLERAN